MWSRIANRGSRTRHIANEDSEDARLTRDVVQSVMSASRASTARASSEPSADGGVDSDSEEAWVRELEREMEQGDTADGDNLPLNASRELHGVFARPSVHETSGSTKLSISSKSNPPAASTLFTLTLIVSLLSSLFCS